MRVAIILSSLAIVAAVYLILSWRERNYINVLTPFILVNVPAFYLLELVYQAIADVDGSVYAYLFCYSAYALGFIATAVGYLIFPARRLPIMLRLPRLRIPFIAFALLLCGVLLYLPVLIEHPQAILSPREIYTVTRTGFGVQFFLSTFLVYLSFIVLLFSRSVGRLALASFVLIALVVIYLHGSKGQILFFFLIALYYLVFVKGWQVSFGRLLVVGGSSLFGMLLLFYVTLPANMKEDLLAGIASYSDYTRNAALVVDDTQLEPQWGRLTLEAGVLTAVPRAVFPDKPKDFGSFWLAKRYYPEWFEADTGSPAFGIGVQYADFGPLAIVWHAGAQLLIGMLLKLLVTRLRTGPDAGTFVLLLTLLQVQLIPTGSELPLVVYYCVALVANVFTPGGAIKPQPNTAAAGIAATA